jgi:DNA polymerase III epsilon subunit-like protein
MKLKNKQPKVLIFDIESLPNKGFFWHPWDDKMLPLAFIEAAKAICTISYKWMDEKKAKVLIVKTPYDDAGILAEFLEIWEQADYVIGHYGDGFDIPYLAGRLMANRLPPLPLVPSIDTFKLAKRHFGKTLNSNRLDHLGEILGLGRKNKTDASLWVRCANGDPRALKEMAAYNMQDVYLLEKVWVAMKPYVQSKYNVNLFLDISDIVCYNCESSNLQKRGTFVTKTTKKQRLHCQDCGSWMTTKYEKETKNTKETQPNSEGRKKSAPKRRT